MLQKIAEITLITKIDAGNYIFREGEDAKHLYSIIDGKVGLEIEKDSSTRILVDTLKKVHFFCQSNYGCKGLFLKSGRPGINF
jgi:CRP-like cAMP-binding protein